MERLSSESTETASSTCALSLGLYFFLTERGYGEIWNGLSDHPTEREVMGRLVELAPTERMDMKTALHRFTTLLNASAYLQDPAYANELKKRVRVHAYMPSSPLRRAALEALSEQDPAAAQIVAEEKKQKLDALRSQVHKVVHTCCHDR